MKKLLKWFCLYLLIMLNISGLSFGDELIVPDSIKDSILYEFSGLKALDYIASLCNFDRSGASQGLYDSQVWVSDKLKSWGIKDVVIDSYPADAKTFYLDTHRARLAWEKKKAKLFLVEPYAKKIIDFDEIPTALIKYSNSANVTAELIDIGSGMKEEDYAGKDVKDKIVFTSSSSYAVYPIAIKEKGALGIISYWENYEPERSRFPDQVAWMSFPQELDTNNFGFAVSRNIADDLKTLLSKGRVVLRAEVEAQNKIGKYHVLSSSLPGTEMPDKEIILTAHINHYKPAANDNASGCALLMEIERAAKAMVDEGLIPPLKRSLRFVWTLEHTGTKVYIDGRPDLDKRGIAAINLDMVGENVLLCESSIRLVLGPHSCPSFLDDLMNNIMSFVAQSNFTEKRGTTIPFTYVHEAYNGAISDHYYYPTGRIGIPATFLYAWPDNFYHSNEDTPDKCDPTLLKRLGFVSAAAALYLASAGEPEALELCNLVYSEGSKRLAQAAKQGLNLMQNVKANPLHRAYFEAVNHLEKTSEKEAKSIQSIFKLSQTKKVENRVEYCLGALLDITQIQKKFLYQNYTENCAESGFKPQKLSLTDKERKYDLIIPQRHFRGPLYLRYVKTKMSQEKREWFDQADKRIRDFFLIKDEIINFVDDENSILDIRNAVSAEFYPLDLDDVYTFLDGIRETGYITFADK